MKKLFSYIPQNCNEKTKDIPYVTNHEYRDELTSIIPENSMHPYDMKEVINGIIDQDSFLEIHESYAENIVVGFARLAGKSIGIVANQPYALAGVLDVGSSKKDADLSAFVIVSIYRYWYRWMCRGFCRVQIRNGMPL